MTVEFLPRRAVAIGYGRDSTPFLPCRWMVIGIGILVVSVGLFSCPATSAEARSVAHAASGVAGTYVALSPARIADTRAGSGYPNAGQTLGAGGIVNVEISGGTVPANGVSAAVLNVTVVNPTAATFLTVYPEGATRPLVANANVIAGQTSANLVTVEVGTQGGVTVYNHSGSTDLVVDVEGYYTVSPLQSGLYDPVNPSRLLGTSQSGANIGPGGSTPVQVTGGTTGVPADASAVVANVTAAGSTGSGFLTVYPAQLSTPPVPPTTANVTFSKGQVIGNRVIVPVGANGQIDLYNHSGIVNVDVDLYGYYTGSSGELGSAFTPLDPVRFSDTRAGINGSAISADSSESFNFLSDDIPTLAVALAANITVLAGPASGFLTIYPTNESTPPVVGDVNFTSDGLSQSFAVAPLNGAATEIFNSSAAPVGIVVDAFGYFAPPPTVVRVFASPATLPSDGMSTSVLTVTVITGSGVAFDDPVTLISTPSVAGACGITSLAGSTNAYGQVTSTYTASVTAGTCTITATEANGGVMGSTVITQTPT